MSRKFSSPSFKPLIKKQKKLAKDFRFVAKNPAAAPTAIACHSADIDCKGSAWGCQVPQKVTRTRSCSSGGSA